MKTEIAPYIGEFVEKAEFPYPLVEKLKSAKIFNYFLKKPYGENFSSLGIGCLLAEAARVDAGVATFCAVSWGLVMTTILELGSQE